MLDIKKIKENPDAVKAGLKAKEVDCDAIVDKILELDVQVRGLKTSTESKTAQKNKLSKENGKLFGQKKGAEKKGEDTSAIEAQIAANMAESVKIDEAIADDKENLKKLDEELYTALLSLPNLPDADLLPGGKENNEPLRYIGEKGAAMSRLSGSSAAVSRQLVRNTPRRVPVILRRITLRCTFSRKISTLISAGR